MEISLPPDLARFVTDRVAQGDYASPVDVVIAGVELLRVLEMMEQWPAEVRRREIDIGVAEADHTELGPFDPVGSLAKVRRRVEGG